MTGQAFFDANILIYADDASAPEKQERAISLIVEHQRRDSPVVSLQVLQRVLLRCHTEAGSRGGNRAT